MKSSKYAMVAIVSVEIVLVTVMISLFVYNFFVLKDQKDSTEKVALQQADSEEILDTEYMSDANNDTEDLNTEIIETELGDTEVTETEVEGTELSTEELEELQEEEKKQDSTPHKPKNKYPYFIRVNRLANCVTVYEKDENGNYSKPIKAMICSVGRNREKTPMGSFRTSAKYSWRYLFGNQYGRYTTRITGHILFHSVPYLAARNDTLKTEYYNMLGVGDSMGCVRLTCRDAKWIYDNCALGTTVEIYESEDPGPLGKPSSIKIDPSHAYAGWDPTDPDPSNPWDVHPPIIEGVKDIQVERGSTASLLGDVKAFDFAGNALSLRIDATVDYETCGEYVICYTAVDNLGASSSLNAKVKVVDTIAPLIQQISIPVIDCNTVDIEAKIRSCLEVKDGAKGIDVKNVQFDLTELNHAMEEKVSKALHCLATVEDAYGNQGKLMVQISYVSLDQTPPVITIQEADVSITVDLMGEQDETEITKQVIEEAISAVKQADCIAVKDDVSELTKEDIVYSSDSKVDVSSEKFDVIILIEVQDEAGNKAQQQICVPVQLVHTEASTEQTENTQE